jgi:hypothetical protein
MKSAFPNFLVVFALLSLFACGGNPADTTDNTNPITDVGANSDTTSSIPVPVEVQKPTCEKIGTMLEGNEFWAQDVNKLVRIVATEETKDPNLGDSHRVLQVYDGMNCQLMNEKILPVDVSADFAYTIADITYNNDSKIIAIQSFKKIYCYDILNDKLFRSVEPKFINERFAEDGKFCF